MCEIERMPGFIRIGFEGIGGLAAYDLDRPVTLEGHDDRYVEV